MSIRAWLAHPVSCDCPECAYVWAHLDDDDDGGDAADD